MAWSNNISYQDSGDDVAWMYRNMVRNATKKQTAAPMRQAPNPNKLQIQEASGAGHDEAESQDLPFPS